MVLAVSLVERVKVVRSFQLSEMAENGYVKISDTIYKKIVDELVEFTGEEGGEDNIVDACSGSARFWTRPKRKVKI